MIMPSSITSSLATTGVVFPAGNAGVRGILKTADEKTLTQVSWPKEACKKLRSKGHKSSGLWGDGKSGCKPKKGKEDKADEDDKHGTEDDKPCRSPSKSGDKVASQEQVPGTLYHSRRLAGSMSGDGYCKKSK